MIDEARNRALCIHPLYASRPDAVAFDDRKLRDEWQGEVYAFAFRFAAERSLARVIDVGCGSGFKLMKYFSGYSTLGYELEPALVFLNETYPDREWAHGDDLHRHPLAGDLLICADVIEHLADPTGLLQLFARSTVRYIVLSTPALEILAERGQSPRLGPPNNQSHVNEWTTREFGDFVAMHLNVIEHTVVSCRQGTQMVLARPK